MTDKVKLAGVIGQPIAHSRSPHLHGHWLKRYGISGHYIPMEVAQSDLKSVLETLPKMGFQGVNVTLPHKEAVLELADSVTDRAALIGAANTLTFTADGRIQADNTDGVGFLANIQDYVPEWSAKSGPCVVFGAGGASRAIIAALSQAGAPLIRVTNRTRARSDALKDHFGAKIEVVDWVQAGNVLDDASLLVNTTSLGMQGKSALRVPLDGLRPETVVTDIVYTPLETELLRTAKAAGCRTVDGLGMLLHQAAPGFERWFGTAPEVDMDLRKAVLAS
ncbi:shikimate dehydrogenase [Thalassobacter stenotrophicus]|jgi:shikimate dehydrogenase|uniref:Shikimate dehydrogenase (NADP(+)) n=2 Tax=Thalassobacter stenotrophicus TaxID=266809 RepID=A0A0P1EZP8_9RHOB|nr:shikimate dehydrogenase [Thalassobacter stenotrophicus]PVZ49528.1 shikimate dehydrogenase [Thalassobacter stenotrophicus]CUH60575.1 Shikimate dehydrogenase [Thalassobacter stenotrophicus]SHJ24338.1 shikimate dehydrogenase [Thalassobacter stenotrophicus DSM 16310]